MSNEQQGWIPSQREQRVLWWLRLTMRFVVGGGGIVWALLTDHLDPVLVLVLGALATSTDVLSFARELVVTAREDMRVADEAALHDRRHADESDP